MKAARHSSVSAHLAYMSSDFVTEGKKIAGLLRRNNAAVQESKKEELPKPLDACMSKSAWRHFATQQMVNDPNVTIQESMKAQRHGSVLAHQAYMKEEVPEPLDTCMSTHEPIKIFEEPDNTQDEFDLFQSERRQIELLRNSELATVQVEDEFDQAMLEPCPPVSQKPFLLSNASSSEQAVETARASYEALVHNKPVMHANAQTRRPILNSLR